MMGGKFLLAYCRICERFREIMHEAPWSSYDLIVSSIVFWLGVYLLMSHGLFGEFSGVYKVLSRLGDERVCGWWFLAGGVAGLLNVLWMTRPPFLVRLLARMVVAFCVLSLAINNLGNSPPPASAITYSVLALAALWSVLRTKASGR